MRVMAAVIGVGVVAGFTNAAVVPEAMASLRRTPLTVQVHCAGGGCNAYASGGTGVYDSWEWYGAAESFDGGGSWSSADASDYCISGAAVQVAARVTDSSGTTALGDDMIFCPH